MAKFSITNTISGSSLGCYEADSKEGALDAMARDSGFDDYAGLCDFLGPDGALSVEEQTTV